MPGSNEDKIESYVDRTGFANDTKFVLEQLNTIFAAYTKLSEIKVGFGNVQGLASIGPLAKEASVQIDTIAKANATMAESAMKASTAAKIEVSSYAELAKQYAQNEVAQKALLKTKKEIEAAFKAGNLTSAEYIKQLGEIKEKQTQLSVSGQQMSRALKNIEKESQAAEGSLDELRAQLNLALQSFDALSGVDKKSDLGKELEARIQSLTKTINEQEQSTGRFGRNVGNYAGSAKIIVDALEAARVKVSEVEKQFGQASPEAAQVRKEFDALNRITGDPKFLNIAANIGDTNKELKFFTQRLNELEDAGLKSSQVYKEVQGRLAQLTDQIGDTRAEIKAMSSDSRAVDQFASSVNFAADVFQTAAGAAVLFGASEKDAAEATKTLVAIQSVSNGVRGIATQLTEKGTAANKVFAFAQLQVRTAMDATASSGARLKAALITTGIGGLIIGIGLLAANFGKLKDFLTGTSRESERFAEAQKRISEFNTDVSASVAKESSELLILKTKIEDTNLPMNVRIANVKSLQALYPQYFKDLKQEDILNGNAAIAYDAAAAAILRKAKALAANKKIEELSQKDLDLDEESAKDKARTDAAIANAKDRFKIVRRDETELAKTRKQVQAELKKDFEERETLREKERQSIKEQQNFFLGTLKSNTDLTDPQRQQQEDEIKKAAEERKKLAEKAAEEAKKIKEANAKAAFEIFKIEKQRVIDFNKAIVDNEKAGYNERLAALLYYVEYKTALIEEEARVELSSGTKTAKELEAIQIKRNDLIFRLADEATAKRSEINKALTDELTKDEKELQAELAKVIEEGFNRFQDQNQKRIDQEKDIQKQLLDIEKEGAEQRKNNYKQLYEELGQLISDFFTASQEKQIAAIDSDISALELKSQQEIDLINQTVSDKAKAADEITIIEAKTLADKQVLENKKKEIEKRKASIEKLVQVATITGNTIQGVVSLSVKAAEARATAALLAANPLTAAYAPVALAQSALIASQIPFVIGLGAAQIARLALPKFKHGKSESNNYQGPAIVGDGGKSELIQRSDGTLEVTPNKPTLTMIGRDDIIHPDAGKMAASAMLFARTATDRSIGIVREPANIIDIESINKTMKKEFAVLGRTIKNKTENHFHSPSPLSLIMKKNGDGSTKYL